jgi:hypothetical protein
MDNEMNKLVDPAAQALRAFVSNARVDLDKMPAWERQYLSGYSASSVNQPNTVVSDPQRSQSSSTSERP